MVLLIWLTFLCLPISDAKTFCKPVETVKNDPYAPSLTINTLEFPEEKVLPLGHNVTIICISNASKQDQGIPGNAKPYWIHFYYNDGVYKIHECGGGREDSEESKVCPYVIHNASRNDSGNYTCWAQNKMRCTLGHIELDFKDPASPTFVVDLPRNLAVPSGHTATLTCQALGIPLPAITWFKNGRRLPHSSVKGYSFLRFAPIRSEDRGQYWCEASNLAGWNRSSNATVTVLWKPIFTIQPQDKNVKIRPGIAVSVDIKCAAEGLPLPTISWLKNNVTLVNEFAIQNGSVSTLNLVFRSISIKHPTYRCVATNAVGTTLSKEVTLAFSEIPAKSVAETQSVAGLSQLLWPPITAGFVVIIVVAIIFIVVKQKRWMKANNQRNLEIVKTQQEFIELQIKNGVEVINQLRNSHSSASTGSIQEGTLSTTDGHDDAIDSELYVQCMDTENRNWEIPRNRLLITEEKLGGGEFGIVTKGVYLRNDGNELPVAVKRLKDNRDHKERMSLISELAILIHVGRHPNIVSLVGACTFEEPLCVVIELVPGGSLDKILHSSHVQPERDDPPYTNIWSRLTERELLKIALDVANGMRHLESKKCIHRDLACRNVLLGNGLVAKVADFGMSRDISRDGHYIKTSQGRIPWLWMSIEALRGISTIKGDVWSFGVVLWEIVTLGEVPYRGVTGLVELHEMLTEGVRLKRPAHCSEELYDVMLKCWQHSPDNRPSFEDLSMLLNEILHEKERIYINITFFEENEREELDTKL